MQLTEFEALSFDCYGTLIDWETGLGAVLGAWASRQGLQLGLDELLTAYGTQESAAEAAHPTELYPGILARSFRALGRQLGATVPARDAAALAASVPQWPAFSDSHDALVRLGDRFLLVILSNVGPALVRGVPGPARGDVHERPHCRGHRLLQAVTAQLRGRWSASESA